MSVLCACSQLGTLEQGKPMHCYIIENNLTLNLKLLTFVVDMYAKCGAIEEVVVVFRSAPKDKTEVHLWNAIIRGLASHEYVREVLNLLMEMSIIRIVPVEITYMCLLSACAH